MKFTIYNYDIVNYVKINGINVLKETPAVRQSQAVLAVGLRPARKPAKEGGEQLPERGGATQAPPPQLHYQLFGYQVLVIILVIRY